MSALANVTESDFQATIDKGLTLVDFWAPWCGPCRMLTPTLEKVQAELGEKVKIVKVNTDENPALSNQFRVMNIPYMILFKDGEVVGQMAGVRQKKDLINFISEQI